MNMILDIFGNVSELKINMQKYELFVISMPAHQVEQLTYMIQYKSSVFPMKYLGLPLSDKRVPKQHYKLLIDDIQDALPGWKANNLSIAGRGVLVNAVLSAKLV
jgi:hypothetical protein